MKILIEFLAPLISTARRRLADDGSWRSPVAAPDTRPFKAPDRRATVHKSAARRLALGAVRTCVEYKRQADEGGRPTDQLPSTVGISFQIR